MNEAASPTVVTPPLFSGDACPFTLGAPMGAFFEDAAATGFESLGGMLLLVPLAELLELLLLGG